MKIRAHVYISGRVQGVFFRAWTEDEAVKRDLTGWVRNLADGRVEAIFEGEEEMVKDMIKACWKGPPGALVKDVKVIFEEFKGEFNDFRVIYGKL
ncbi:MAG: acylphosphatase [Candidatus Methanomethyliaceae archaeon]|nr:acylphosphatase [Candidatus Methanomethyliaceae archaeon]MDW7970760.1 acylphosphatase [Nitrososphaerota archaeon]